MAPRVKERQDAEHSAPEGEKEAVSQRKPELARYWLQVDRQTKRSFSTARDAETAGLLIKKGHPLVQVSVYDSVELVSKAIELPTESGNTAG
jgi:hypothetical protein